MNQNNFNKIPGSPIAYWANEKMQATFQEKPISKYIECKSGIMAGDEKFIELWHEPSIDSIKFDCLHHTQMGTYRWFPLNSGGGFRKWYGNNSKVIDLADDARNIRTKSKNYRLREKDYYFQEGITWGRITTAKLSFRVVPKGSLFGDAGPIGFIEKYKLYALAFLSSKVVDPLIEIKNPTMNFQINDIMALPFVLDEQKVVKVEDIVEENIDISKKDWDLDETSWDFKKHPLI